MSNLSKEEVLLSSNDNSITLTTHRVLQKTSKINKEILLKDIVGTEIVKRRSTYYIVLAIMFILLASFLYILKLQNKAPFDTMEESAINFLPGVSAFLAILAIYYTFTSTKKVLKISGRFNEIEFLITELSESSLSKFINQLTVESDNRKRED